MVEEINTSDHEEPFEESENAPLKAEKDSPEADESAKEVSEPPTSVEGSLSHLTSSVPRASRIPGGAISKEEMAQIRSVFGDMDDAEIHRLYKRVTKN